MVKEGKVDAIKKWRQVVPRIIAMAKSEARAHHIASHLKILEGLSQEGIIMLSVACKMFKKHIPFSRN